MLPCNTRDIHCQTKSQINKLKNQRPIKMLANKSSPNNGYQKLKGQNPLEKLTMVSDKNLNG
jgi:hypothetical protein